MLGGRVDVRAAAELLDPVESLELGRVHHGDEQRVQHDGPMNPVVDTLARLRMTPLRLLATHHEASVRLMAV